MECHIRGCAEVEVSGFDNDIKKEVYSFRIVVDSVYGFPVDPSFQHRQTAKC